MNTRCAGFVQATDWYHCFDAACSNKIFTHTTYEYSTVCSTSYSLNSAAGAEDDACEQKTEDTPIVKPGILSLNDIIDDSELAPCLKNVLSELKNSTKGAGWIINKFATDTVDYNWSLQSSQEPLTNNANASTSSLFDSSTKTISTKFDINKFKSSSDLSVARTMLHESIHAYLIAKFRNDYLGASKSYPELVSDHLNEVYVDMNNLHHAEFVRQFVMDIAESLEDFGVKRGYNLNSSYYLGLAWGGLTDWPKRDAQGELIRDSQGELVYEETPWFKSAFHSSTDRNRIKVDIATEQGLNNFSKKGQDAGC